MAEMAARYPALVALAPYLSLCEFAPAFTFGIENLVRLVEILRADAAVVLSGRAE